MGGDGSPGLVWGVEAKPRPGSVECLVGELSLALFWLAGWPITRAKSRNKNKVKTQAKSSKSKLLSPSTTKVRGGRRQRGNQPGSELCRQHGAGGRGGPLRV